MRLLDGRDVNTDGMTTLFVILLLSFGLTLSLSLIKAAPALAQDECNGRVASGAAEWFFPGPAIGVPFELSGHAQFQMKECHHKHPARGWVYILTYETGSWVKFSMSVEGGAVKIVSGSWNALDVNGDPYVVDGEAACVKGQIIDASDPDRIGGWVAGPALDAGTPGRDGDGFQAVSDLTKQEADAVYENCLVQGPGILIYAPVVKGNVQIR